MVSDHWDVLLVITLEIIANWSDGFTNEWTQLRTKWTENKITSLKFWLYIQSLHGTMHLQGLLESLLLTIKGKFGMILNH